MTVGVSQLEGKRMEPESLSEIVMRKLVIAFKQMKDGVSQLKGTRMEPESRNEIVMR